MTLESAKKTITQWAQQLSPHVLAIYGFGSFFKGEQNEESDIDVGVLFEGPLPNTKRWNQQENLVKIMGRNVDLVDLHKATPVFQVQVIGEGILLYQTDPQKIAAFETVAMS